MLTPMLVQYLVGLCCVRRNPGAVDITLGDMVMDPVAQKERDVDVTVTVEESPGVVRAFKAYEVKREKSSLDVAVVEQLCMKLMDMDSITHKAIVSTSGFTDGAQAKASHHGVELYVLKPWETPIEADFPNFSLHGLPEEALPFGRKLLRWQDWKLQLITPTHRAAFEVKAGDPLFNSTGATHRFATYGAWQDDLLLRSTETLFTLDPAATIERTFPHNLSAWVSVGPAWPHTHTIDVSREDVHVEVGEQLIAIDLVTINGYLQWEHRREHPQFLVMRKVTNGEAFAGALIALGQREGQMLGFIISDSPTTDIHLIELEEKHWNMIRRLKLEMPESGEEQSSGA